MTKWWPELKTKRTWNHGNQVKGGCLKDERIGFLFLIDVKSYKIRVKMPGR